MTRATAGKTKLLICVWHPFTLWRPPADVGISVQRAFPEMRVVHLTTYEHIDDELPDTDIFVGYSLREEQFLAAKKLKWIHSTAAGVGQLMFPALREGSVVLTNASGVHSVPMAEHLLGLLLALARRFPSSFHHQLKRHWGQQEIWDDQLRPRELMGQTLLFVGFGAIGRETAKRVRPLGMKIWAVTRSGKGDPALADRYLPADKLEEVLHLADYVILAAPETPETLHLMNAKRLAAMKPTAFLINVARGTLIDEQALIETLKKRAIAGVALDVTEEEPLPSDSPLWTLENCLITPHISGGSDVRQHRGIDHFCDNLRAYLDGRPLTNVIDWARGY